MSNDSHDPGFGAFTQGFGTGIALAAVAVLMFGPGATAPMAATGSAIILIGYIAEQLGFSPLGWVMRRV